MKVQVVILHINWIHANSFYLNFISWMDVEWWHKFIGIRESFIDIVKCGCWNMKWDNLAVFLVWLMDSVYNLTTALPLYFLNIVQIIIVQNQKLNCWSPTVLPLIYQFMISVSSYSIFTYIIILHGCNFSHVVLCSRHIVLKLIV